MSDDLLQAPEVAYMRAMQANALPDTVHIQRRTLVADKQGGFSQEWGIAYPNVPARLAFASGAERFAVGREDVQVQLMLTVSYDQSVEQADRILFGSDTLEVVSVTEPRSWDTAKRCQLRKV